MRGAATCSCLYIWYLCVQLLAMGGLLSFRSVYRDSGMLDQHIVYCKSRKHRQEPRASYNGTRLAHRHVDWRREAEESDKAMRKGTPDRRAPAHPPPGQNRQGA